MSNTVTDSVTHRVTWFDPPDRPVEGGTVFVRPESNETAEGEPCPGGHDDQTCILCDSGGAP